MTDTAALAQEIVRVHEDIDSAELKWKPFDLDDPKTWPTVLGLYAVMISGDSESIDGHVIYEFPDYQAYANLVDVDTNPDDPTISFVGFHEEDEYTIFAWYGPLHAGDIPEYKNEVASV